jgi:Tol biopolymer transport system component
MRRAALMVVLASLALGSTDSATDASGLAARHGGASLTQTSWSPDGKWIASIRTDYGYDLLVVAPEGAGDRVLASAVFNSAKWAPTGRHMAWLGYRELAVAEVDRRLVRRLQVRDVVAFDWSPDGEHLLYVDHLGPGKGNALTVSTADGAYRSELVRNAWDPEWAPDGREIAFVTADCGVLGTVRPDGSGSRVVVGGPLGVMTPRWSPAGDRLAYRARCDDNRVHVVGRDGQGDRIVAQASEGSGISWSPAGRWLAVVGPGVELVDTEGTGGARLPGGASFSWSPRGAEVVYARDGAVFVGSIDGTERRVAEGWGPDWSPDGRRISFLRKPFAATMPFWHCAAQLFVIGADGLDERAVSTCRLTAGTGNDHIIGTSGPDEAFAFEGSDRVAGRAGSDRLYGGPGADRLYGGSGPDAVDGGSGADRVGTRDGERDTVRCGRGPDTVFADAYDTVARDCERLLRK